MSTKSSTPPPAPVNVPCSVTNAATVPASPVAGGPQVTWDGSIVCISGYNTGAGTAVDYQQQVLQPMPFSQGNSLAVGATDTVTLESNGVYNLIFAQADNLFPVSSAGAMPMSQTKSGVTTWSAAPLTVPTPTSSTATTVACNNSNSTTVNAWIFLQNISAYPTTTMATAFTAALSTGSSTSATEKAVSNFFQSYPAYANVTLDSYMAVSSYVAVYADPWAGFSTSSYTYYLYRETVSSDEAIDEQTTTGGTACVLMGTVVFTYQAPAGGSAVAATANNGSWVTNNNGNYSIQWNPADCSNSAEEPPKAMPLYFSNPQMLVSDPTSPEPEIALICTYMALSTLTGNNADWGSIVPALVGTLGCIQVLGVSEQATAPSGWDKTKDWLSENIFGTSWFTGLMDLLGVFMLISMVGGGILSLVRWAKKGKGKEEESKEKEKDEDATTQEDQKQEAINEKDKAENDPNAVQTKEQTVEDQEHSLLSDNYKATENEIQASLNRVPDGAQLTPPDQLVQQQQQVANEQQQKQQDIDNQKKKAEEEGEDDMEGRAIEDQAQYGVSSELQEESNKLNQDKQEVSEINPEDANANQQLSDAQKNIDQEGKQVEVQSKKDGEQISADQQADITQVKNVDQNIDETKEENEKDVDEGAAKDEEGDALGDVAKDM